MRNDGTPTMMREVNGDPYMNTTQMVCPDMRQPPRTDPRQTGTTPTTPAGGTPRPVAMEMSPSQTSPIQSAGSSPVPARNSPPSRNPNWSGGGTFGSGQRTDSSRQYQHRGHYQQPTRQQSQSPQGWTHIPSPERPSSPDWGWGWRG